MLHTRKTEMTGGSESSGPRTVMIVDDNLDVLHTMAEMVENLGYSVKTASNGCDALDILSVADDVSLVITDVVMPGEYNGIDLSVRIGADFQIPTILATASPRHHFMRKADKGVELLLKPFSIDELGRRIEAALAIH